MHTIYLYFTITILTLCIKDVVNFYSFFTPCNHNITNTTQNDSLLLDDKEEEEEIELEEMYNHLPLTCCSIKLDTIYNPFEDVLISARKGTVPVCLKCALCLAVAENIVDVFIKVKNEDRDPVNETMLLDSELNRTCMEGFQRYDLRNHDGFYIVSDVFTDSVHVATTYDGEWTEMLRDVCNNLTIHIIQDDAYNAFKSQSLNVTQFLCSGYGIYRDCYNIHFESCDHIHNNNEGKRKYWVSCLFNP